VWVPCCIEKERQHLPMLLAKGTRRILMQPQDGAKRHPFYPTLKQCGAKGLPVNYDPDWEPAVIQQAVAQGPHHLQTYFWHRH
jgi:hypothetical protein